MKQKLQFKQAFEEYTLLHGNMQATLYRHMDGQVILIISKNYNGIWAKAYQISISYSDKVLEFVATKINEIMRIDVDTSNIFI